MLLLENHVMLRDAATNVFNLQYALLENMAWPQSREFFSWKTDFLGYCSHEGQIHSSGSSSVFAVKPVAVALALNRVEVP